MFTINNELTLWQQPKYFLYNFVLPFFYMIRRKKILQHTDTFCLFIGYPRSSHTLIGALLDAHPEIMISTEANAIKMFHAGYPKGLIFGKIISKSKWFAQNGAKWTGYSYEVPNEYQGKYRGVRVIGDKKGEQTTALVRKKKGGLHTLNELERKIRMNVKMIHVIRNPFDNITTIAKGGKTVQRKVDEEVLTKAINRYFLEAKTVKTVKKDCPYPMFDLRNERLISNPKETLKQLCGFLGVEAHESYLENCSTVVLKKIKKTRNSIHWDDKFKSMVENEMQKYRFLDGYSFDN